MTETDIKNNRNYFRSLTKQFQQKDMSRQKFVKEIKNGDYPKTINGIETPVSNPDKSILNNLG